MSKSRVASKCVIIIPNWNGADFLYSCLESLVNQTMKADVLVVDNGSVDNSVEIIRSSFPNVRVLEFSNNAGFAGGVNRGIRHAIKHGYDYVALFNNDAVADKNWIKELVETADKHKPAGIVTGKFMLYDKIHIDSTGDQCSTRGMPFPRGRNRKDEGQFDTLEPVFGATGGASLYKIGMLKQIGLFDEKFFAYYEDVDLSFRANLADWGVLYTPKALAFHRLSGTSSKLGDFARFHSIKNFWMLYFKNMPGVLCIKYLPLFMLQFSRMCFGLLRDKKIFILLKGLLYILVLAPHTLMSRIVIQKNRKVSIAKIDKILYHAKPPKIPNL